MIINYHFKEFVFNFKYFCISFISTTGIIYLKKNIILDYILNLLNLDKFTFFNLTEAFWTFFQLSWTYSLFCNIPFCLFLIFLFCRPALYKYQEQKWQILLISFFIINFIIYFLLLIPKGIPFIFNFFKNFEAENIEYIPTFFNIYIFFIKFSFIFLICLNIPFCLPIFEKKYIHQRGKYIILMLLLIAFITPPDIYSLIIIIIPLIIIIESFLFLKKILNFNPLILEG